MKTSKILLAMALPVAFAACTSEEIVESNNVNLQNRKALPALTAVVESGVDSRFSWNEETFGWNKFTAEDNFAAGLTDAALWTPGDLMLTNYIFNDEAGNGAYTTTSQMVEGTYFFYSYPGFEEIAARKAVPFDLTSQKSVDFKKPAAAVEENQLFVSALYKLEEKTANDALPIKFISYWATAGMKIKNTTGDDIKVVRMMIQTGEDMELRGVLAPSALGTVNKDNEENTGLVYFNDGEGYVLPYDAEAETNPSWDDIKLKDIANTTSDVLNALAEKTMMLTVENGELANDEEATVYFQMPAGKYSNASVTLFVEVYDEAEEDYVVKMLEPVEFEKNAKSAATATENDRTAFQRGSTTAVFGIEDNAIAAHEIVEYDIINAQVSGAYAASYEDLVEIVKNGTEKKISNMGELKVDDAVLKLISSSTALTRGVYEFVNPIEISTSKTTAVALKNFKVSSATITSGKFTLDYDLEGAVTVNPGAELTIKDGQAGKITNKGTLNIETAEAVVVENVATVVDGETIETVVNVKANNAMINQVATAPETLANATYLLTTPTTLNLKACTNTAGTAQATAVGVDGLTIANGKNLYIENKVTVSNEARNLKNNGYVENKGVIKYIANASTKPSTSILTAKIDNYGLIEILKNTTVDDSTFAKASTALVVMKDREAEVRSMIPNDTWYKNDGWVDNTVGGFVADAYAQVYASYTDTEAKSGVLGNVQGVDRIIVKNFTWTDPELPAGFAGVVVMNAMTLEQTLAADNTGKGQADWGTVEVDGNTTFKYAVTMNGVIKNATFMDDLTISSTYSDDLTLAGVTVNGMLTCSGNKMTLVGATLNDVTAGSVVIVDVKCLDVANADGTHTYTAKTTKINGDFKAAASANIYVYNDATLVVENGAVVYTNGVIEKKTESHSSHTGCAEGKILMYGSKSGVNNETTGDGSTGQAEANQ